MRKVTTQADDHATVTVTSPWLSLPEAIIYLGISRSEFYLNAIAAIPYARNGKSRRLYHQDDLDAYLKNKKVTKADDPTTI